MCVPLSVCLCAIYIQSGATGSVDIARLEELERQLLQEKALRAKAEAKLQEVVVGRSRRKDTKR